MPKGSGADPNNSPQESAAENNKVTGKNNSHKAEDEGQCLDGTRQQAFSATLNVGDVNVDDMTVKVKGRKLSVSGQHVESGANGFCFHSFNGEFTLPLDLDHATLTATVSDDHTMRIEGYRAVHISSSSQTDERLSEVRAALASRKRAACTAGRKTPDAKRQQLISRKSSACFATRASNASNRLDYTDHIATEHICSTIVTVPQRCKSKVNCSIRSTTSKASFSLNPRNPKIDMTHAFPISEVQPINDLSRQPTNTSLPDTWLQTNTSTNNTTATTATTAAIPAAAAATPVRSTVGFNITETPKMMNFEPVNTTPTAGKNSCATASFKTFNLTPSPSDSRGSTIIPISSAIKK